MMGSSSESSLFNIEKLDGTNFPFWKEQIYNVLVQKKQVKTLKLQGIKPEDMSADDWDELDELARSTIMSTRCRICTYCRSGSFDHNGVAFCHSKSRGRSNIECYHCHKKGHMKKECHLWKKEKGNDKK